MMPSERSLYRKLELVLSVSTTANTISLDELSRMVAEQQFANFNTRRYDQETDDFVWRQSERVINSAVRFCNELGLVAVSGQPSSNGRKASKSNSFGRVLASCIRTRFADAGIEVERLNRCIVECLTGSELVLPTARELWIRLAPDMGVVEFSRLLTLLTHAGAARANQSRIYLAFVV